MKIRHVRARDIDPHDYIDGANEAFGHWGDEATFAWAFRNDAEFVFLDDDRGRPVASNGITYRTLQNGRPVAIITGAWTSAAARGIGAFARLIRATHEVARERGAITISFGRMDNVSRRRVEEAGHFVHPSFYCRMSAPPQSLDVLDPDPSMFHTGFRYTPDEWRAQFLERPHAQIECVGRRGEWAAIVERTTEFDRVHLLSHEHALSLLARDRRLFWFTLKRPSIECEWTDGFLSTFPAADVSGWAIQNGDRM